MDQPQNSARRDEDIALDLLKFVATTTNILRPATPSTGFTAASNPKPEDQVNQLLELYSRCLTSVQGTPAPAPAAKGAAR